MLPFTDILFKKARNARDTNRKILQAIPEKRKVESSRSKLGFCNLLLIKCFFRWNMTQKLPKITRIYCQLNQYLLLTRYFNDL
jgi:hypothetical protein